jgi:hypothetical protein
MLDLQSIQPLGLLAQPWTLAVRLALRLAGALVWLLLALDL